MPKRTLTLLLILSACFIYGNKAFAQAPTWTLDPFGREKKPKQFEDRKLGSERTADKKFTIPRNVIQNNVTHYNYFFNANNKVNAVVERAKMSFKDDYSKLLPFYAFNLTSTAAQKNDLDSVIITSTAGILLHDLRNDWIDNMYLLIGKAYFYKNEMDSAESTFEFINYNLFPRKKREEDNRVVGTNDAASGSNISIANKEKRNILQKVFSLPPSRNDALIWLCRTLIQMGEYSEAGGLINTLQNDRNLPRRLRNDLDEVTAFWFYKQAGFDSSAVHLERALSNADTKEDKSRWQFLLAQLYEMNGQFDKASAYYKKASKSTVDPLLDIYAHLNDAKMLKKGDPKSLERSIDNLAKMAKHDKFEAYRDIIYFSAGQLSLQIPDTTTAISYFKKSLKYNETNTAYKNKSFLQLGDIAFKRKQYRVAAAQYDSLQLPDSTILAEKMAQVQDRKNALTKLVEAVTNIEREDSLQRIAAMPQAERDDFVKKLLRRLRKENGLKEDNTYTTGDNNNPFSNASGNQQADLFPTNSSGEWYFNNPSRKSKGFNDFKSKWGNRPNADNWRRKGALEITTPGSTPLITDTKGNKKGDSKNTANNNTATQELSMETLMHNLPLTPEKITASNDILADNLVALAGIYQNELEEFELAAITYEDYLRRFPTRLRDGEIYLGLYYCYNKLGNKEKSNYYKNLLNAKFANTKSGMILNNPSAVNPNAKDGEATKVYDQIYNLFIEGNFEKALEEKKKADGVYGMSFWTPQLLYIEALYNVRQHNDSIAIAGLNALISSNPASPLKDKAANMIAVLKRRTEIETYLTNLQVTRQTEDQIVVPADNPQVIKKSVVAPPVKDSVKKEMPSMVSGPFTHTPAAPHYVLMVLDKVDPVYVTEAKNAIDRYNKENYYGQPITITKDMMDADRQLLVITSFADAATSLGYYDKIKKDAKDEISWLPANKYYFLIITEQNLQLLKANKNISGYKNLLNTQYPNRF